MKISSSLRIEAHDRIYQSIAPLLCIAFGRLWWFSKSGWDRLGVEDVRPLIWQVTNSLVHSKMIGPTSPYPAA